MKAILLAVMRWRLLLAGVRCGPGVRVRGMPILYRHPQARIELGAGVVLQSKAHRYHAHMHSPVKLLADRAGAIITIGEATRINGACIHAVKSVSIGARCLFAAGVQVLDSNGHRACMETPNQRIDSVDEGKPVVIEDDVWLGLNVVVLPGTRIGAGSIVGAGVVLSGDIPPRSIVRPASFVVEQGRRPQNSGGG